MLSFHEKATYLYDKVDDRHHFVIRKIDLVIVLFFKASSLKYILVKTNILIKFLIVLKESKSVF